MPSFRELLTATNDELVHYFNDVATTDTKDFVKQIDLIAQQLELNHRQLICALGFNKNTRDLPDIQQKLGFRSFKLLSYRQNELFTKDAYDQLAIDNILDIYSERHEDGQTLYAIRNLLLPRLEYIEKVVDKSNDPTYVMSYKMEIHAIYTSDIIDKSFVDERLKKDIGKFRQLTNELNEIANSDYYPHSNLFFMDALSVLEKQDLIEADYITKDMIKNRLQNIKISKEERNMLEDYL